MIGVEKLRKRTRKNWKKQQRAKFRFLMSCAELSIENATHNCCSLERPCENLDHFALWLVAKKLEAKGFTCELKRGEFTFSGIFYFDELRISWE
jgi:hypothetical protein